MSGCRIRSNAQNGFTLIEVVVGILILTVALLGLAASAGMGLKATTRSREEVRYWADAQEVIDSLMGTGFGNIASGSTTIRGRQISWTAGSAAAAPQSLTVIVQRPNYLTPWRTVSDTILLNLSKSVPGA